MMREIINILPLWKRGAGGDFKLFSVLLLFIFSLVYAVCPAHAQGIDDSVRDYTGKLAVFPGAEGFGTDTPAGRSGRIIKVTTLEREGSGSFFEAVKAKGPRVVVFEVGGTIK